MLHKSLEAAKILQEKHNLDIEVIDLQSLRPLRLRNHYKLC